MGHEALKDSVATRHDLEVVEISLRHEIEILKRELTIRLGAMLAFAVGILAVLMKIL